MDFLAEYFGYITFDLHALYSQIKERRYVSPDGSFVDGRWPEGNFFSADAVNPTAFGQAVIANEIIKLLNEKKNLKIPYFPSEHLLPDDLN